MTKPWKWLSITRPYWHSPNLTPNTKNARHAIDDSLEDHDAILYPGCDRATVLLEAIQTVERLRAQLAEELPLLVHEARAEGASWGQIAKHLGSSRQAAHQRFGAELSPEQLIKLDDQLTAARRWAKSVLRYAEDDEFERALTFLEEQEELDRD